MASLEQIQAKMDKLKAQAEALATKKAQVIVDKIRALMLQHGLTTKDIEADAKTKRATKAVNGSAANVAKASKKSIGQVAAKYQDPKSGATWTGRGRAPLWIAGAKDRNRFLIDGAQEAAPVVKAVKAAKAAKAVKAVKAVKAKAVVGKAAAAPVTKTVKAKAAVSKTAAPVAKVAKAKAVVTKASKPVVKADKPKAAATQAAAPVAPLAPAVSADSAAQ